MEASRRLWLALVGIALVLAAPMVADEALADEHVDEDEPHLLVRITNEHDEEREFNVTIDGPASSWADDVTVPPGGTWEHRHGGPEGKHDVRVTEDDETSVVWVRSVVDNSGCRGPYLLGYVATGSSGLGSGESGCLGEPERFFALVDEALAARDADEGEAIEVAQPADETQGRYLVWGQIGAPDWEEAAKIPFAWQPNTTFHDEHGREVTGSQLVYDSPYYSWASAHSGPLFGADASTDEVVDRFRYADGETRPTTMTRPTGAASMASPIGASAEAAWEIRYDPKPTFLDCLFRNAQQGQPLPAGAGTDRPCLGLHEELAWWTGERGTDDGFATVTQYGIDDPEDPTAVAKIVWAEGVAYPLHAETFTHDPDGTEDSHRAANLTNLTRAGQPLTTTGSANPEPDHEEAVLAPLEGPGLTDDGRVPFSLAEASQAAQADPTLTDLQALLANDEAILAGAHLAPDEATDLGDARALTWTIAYTAPGQGPVLVACQQPTGEAAGTRLSSPTADCRQLDEAPDRAQHLDELPQRGTGALPTSAPRWDAALERWRLLDPANASAELTLAGYDPLGQADPSDPAHLAVGTAGSSPEPGPTESSEAPTTVSIAVADGATIAQTTGVKDHEGLTEPAEPLSPSTVAPPGDDAGLTGGDPLVPAATGAGLLGLLALGVWALYSRLTEDEVLAHDTREQIRQLVDEQPGIHGKAIARQVDANERTVEHHVDVLVREDVLTVLERGGYNHHFVQGQHTPKQMRALASLQRGQAEDVYEAVRHDPGLDMGSLADTADISKPYASKLVDQLVDVGLVDRVREGRRTKLYANEI